MITLGIETSCDETALAIIETHEVSDVPHKSTHFEYRIIDSLVHSQAELHSAYGGVYPSLAKREHGRNLVPLLHKLLLKSTDILAAIAENRANLNASKAPADVLCDEQFNEIISQFKSDLENQNPDLWQTIISADFLKSIPRIDRIAVTEGPGLEPTLWVGISFARILGALWTIPIIPIDHMEGHIIGSLLETDKPTDSWQVLKPVEFPAIALLISGGHTELVRIDPNSNHQSKFAYSILGNTVDDAVGEAFDKVARLLGLPYPGGPHISRLSNEAEELMTPSPVKLPRPMMKSGDFNFSFSGLKTAVLYATRNGAQTDGSLTDEFKRGLAYEFELAVADTLTYKLRSAIEEVGAKTIIVGGGVSANTMLRKRFTKLAEEYNMPLYLPSRHVSGDNALMIALVGALDSTPHSQPLKADGTKKLGNR